MKRSTTSQTKAEFGSSEGAQHAHQRVARVTVRVGDYKTDSSGGRGDGSLELAALDNDPIALRSALWTATDQAYKNALSAYAQKQASSKQVQTPPQADDFSQEKPVISLADPVKLHLDENAWAQRVARASGLYRTDPAVSAGQRDIEYSTASFRARASPPPGSSPAREPSSANPQRSTRNRLPRVRKLPTACASTAPTPHPAFRPMNSTPSPSSTSTRWMKSPRSQTCARRRLLKRSITARCCSAPTPAADTLRALLAGAVAATRPPLGTEARTNGAFASSFHARVLPDFLSVVDDPGLKTFDGKGLLGAYDVDDEGVPAQAVKLVDAGRLDNYLIGRQPVRDFPQSNGHGRAGITGAARPVIGVLKISAENGLTSDELNQKLLAIAKDRGLPGVYFVQTMGGELTPRLLYRIGPDSKRQLVRGAELDDIDDRALRSSVEAAGKDLWLANYFGDPPATVIAPALLFDDATVRRANEKNEKLPFYPPPD